jgi:hypothetical protein
VTIDVIKEAVSSSFKACQLNGSFFKFNIKNIMSSKNTTRACRKFNIKKLT